MVQIVHLSDSHGDTPYIEHNCKIVVHSGDFLDNNSYERDNNKTRIKQFQKDWLIDNVKDLKENLIRGADFLFTLGNHDFLEPDIIEDIFKDNGVNAICLHDKIVKSNDISFYGFPYIPPITGWFNYEADDKVMKRKLANYVKLLDLHEVEIFVAHCPMYGISDSPREGSGIHYGSHHLLGTFSYQVPQEKRPTYYCHGHVHEGKSIKNVMGMTVVNSATTHHIIDI